MLSLLSIKEAIHFLSFSDWLLAFIPVILAGLGVYVSLKAPATAWGRIICIAVFLVLGGAAALISLWQTAQERMEQATTSKQQEDSAKKHDEEIKVRIDTSRDQVIAAVKEVAILVPRQPKNVSINVAESMTMSASASVVPSGASSPTASTPAGSATPVNPTGVNPSTVGPATAEIQRRNTILALLKAEYVLSHDDIGPPPIEWINQRLKELQQPWTVKSEK